MGRLTPKQGRLLLIGGVALTGAALATRTVGTPHRAPVATLPTVPSPAPGGSTPAPAPSTPTRAQLISRCVAAIYKEVPARRLSPNATRDLATALVTVCAEESYPLDLAFAHAYAESALDVNAVNRNSGASGPLQVTAVAAQQVGVAWPLTTAAATVRAGVRYMKWLRSAYAECAGSVRTSLRHYGMGRGNWLKFSRGELSCSTTVSVARAELGCPGNRPYSATIIAIAQRHPELRTTSWWGS